MKRLVAQAEKSLFIFGQIIQKSLINSFKDNSFKDLKELVFDGND